MGAICSHLKIFKFILDKSSILWYNICIDN
jgi:hypothetical protein